MKIKKYVALLLTAILTVLGVTQVSAHDFPVYTTGYDRGYSQGMYGSGTVVSEGIDVSKWNEPGQEYENVDFNFQAIKDAGYDYVIIRAGSTNLGEDPMFDKYYEKAKSVGLDVGAYFYSYATNTDVALSDADKCISYIQGKQFEYPIYMDFEDPTQEKLSSILCGEICKTFLDTVAEAGYLTGIYSYSGWLERNWVTTWGIRDKYEGWAAYHLKSQDHTKYDEAFGTVYGMYQYTALRELEGVTGTFDANVCYKDYPGIVKKYGFNGYPAGEFQQTENGVCYSYYSGGYVTGWQQFDGKWYCFNADGYAETGWIISEETGLTYYADKNGEIVTEWALIEGKVYYFHPSVAGYEGFMVTGDRKIDGADYSFDENGVLIGQSPPEVPVYPTEDLTGDMNRNGRIDINDVTEIQKIVADIITVTDIEALTGDVDGNGELNISDATIIQRYLARQIKKLPHICN